MKNLFTKMTIIVLVLASFSTIASAEDTKGVDIANGAQVWSDVCMRCHNLRAPEDLSKRAWKYSMQHMRVRAGLTGQETRNILAFIQSSKTMNDTK